MRWAIVSRSGNIMEMSQMCIIFKISSLISHCFNKTMDSDESPHDRNKSSLICLCNIKFQLQKYFECPDILNQTMQNIIKINESSNINHFIKGKLWKQKLNQLPNKTVFPIFLYFDSFQINDALGSHSHSVCGIYFSIPVIPQQQLSKLNNIFVAGFLNASDMKDFGNHLTLKKLIDVLHDIGENGIEISHNNEIIKIHFILGQILGDNLGLNEILDYQTSFVGNNFCRICTQNKTNCQTDLDEKSESLRDKDMYDLECANNGINTAVKENSIWNTLYLFHVTDNKACDIMHDIYLGVARYNIQKILNHFIYVKKYFSLETFNYRKQMFEYGPVWVGNVSPPLKKSHIIKGNFKMNAAEMKTFLKVILLLISNLKVPDDDPVFNFLVTFIEIVDIIVLDNFDNEILLQLKCLINRHHQMYIECFQEPLKPKHHFMVHYPGIIRYLGPLIHIWCFRFEGKHQFSKKYCHMITSRINVPYTLSVKHSLLFSSNVVNNGFFKNIKTLKGIKNVNLSTFSFYPNLVTDMTQGFEAKSVKYNGIFYEKGSFIKTENVIMKILLIFFLHKDTIFIISQEVNTLFLNNYQAYEVLNLMHSFHIKPIDHFRSIAKIVILNTGESVLKF